MTYKVEAGDKRIILRFGADGSRVVSRRMRAERELPVIDLLDAEVAEVLGDAERLRVVIREDAIYVTVHHHESAESERLERFRQKLNTGKVSIGSLAHGAGILDHALHTGLADRGVASRLAFAVEIEKAYLDASQDNNPIWDRESIAIEAPMQEVEVGKLPKVEILAAGLPCVGASLSGRAKNGLKRAEEHETAGSLFLAFLNVVQATQPAVVLLENVPPYQNTASYTVICSVLEELGYTVHDTVLNGRDMGALEARERLCMVAMTKGLDGDPFASLEPTRVRESTVSEVLEAIPADSDRWKTYDYLAAKEVRDKEAGKGFRRQLLDGREDRVGTIGKGYNKARFPYVEPFIVHPDNPELSRLLSPTEHARVKTIPEQMVRGLSDTIAHEVMGNSVIHAAFVAVGRSLAMAIHRALYVPQMMNAA
jgi:DNA (cytosine-5)-methyltransferase 1